MIERIKELDAKFQQLTGRPAFAHMSAPTPTSERWAFHTGEVKTSSAHAYEYMLGLLQTAESDPANLPYPLDQPLPAS